MTTNSFWDFSVQLYARSGVEKSCLSLQNEYDLDVNIVLFCLWYGAHYGSASSSRIQQVCSFSDTWASNVVRPLRGTRRWMNNQRLFSAVPPEEIEKLRNAIKQLELHAERLQQIEMESLVEDGPTENSEHCSKAMMNNLLAYLKILRIDSNPQLIGCYQAIMAAME